MRRFQLTRHGDIAVAALALLLSTTLLQFACSETSSTPSLLTGRAGPSGSECDPVEHNGGCLGSTRMTCDPATSTWVVATACASGRVCLERGGAHIVHWSGADDTACCEPPPSVSCQSICEERVAAGFLRDIDGLPEKLGLAYNCDPNLASCLCKPWAKGGLGLCRVPCEGLADLGGANRWVGVDFSLPDRKFTDVQVVTAFPVHIEAGKASRVCGAALAGEPALSPNGVELTLNLVGSELTSPSCDGDPDLSVKAGEMIELAAITAEGSKPTVGPNNLPITIDCVDPHGPVPMGGVTGCQTPVSNANLSADVVRYQNIVDRCDDKDPETRLNLAILVDHSGSISGFVDKDTLLEDQAGDIDQPEMLEPSDQSHARIRATERLIDSLNAQDRAIAYYFDEKVGAAVAASDQLACEGGTRDGKRCVADGDCPEGVGCFRGSGDPAMPVLDTFLDKTLSEAEADAFGSTKKSRTFLKAALDFKVKYDGDGRAPLWHGVQTAYNFLKKGSLASAKGRHIVVITDGPDTCKHSDDFAYSNGAGKCRIPCGSADADFAAVLKLMHSDKYPVHVHFIQFQAQAQEYRKPDPRMMEVACRSGGTYQFINSQEMNTSSSEFSNALTRAALRVRYALSGSWRVSFGLPYFGKDKALKPGTLWAIRGRMSFKNKLFPSVDPIYASQSAWRFGIDTGNQDRRLLLRTACTQHSDCGGNGDCGANHCADCGVCAADPAPDRRPCNGGAGVCCGAACDSQSDCKKSCK